MTCLSEPKFAEQWMTGVDSMQIEDEPENKKEDKRTIMFENQPFVQTTMRDGDVFTSKIEGEFCTVVDRFEITKIEIKQDDPDNQNETDSNDASTAFTLKRVSKFQYHGWHKIMAPFLRNGIANRLSKELDTIKSLAESAEE